jgi:hypothetical protein
MFTDALLSAFAVNPQTHLNVLASHTPLWRHLGQVCEVYLGLTKVTSTLLCQATLCKVCLNME